MIRARNGIYERQLQHQQPHHNERCQPGQQRNQNYNNNDNNSSSRATLLNAIEEQRQQQQQQHLPYRRLAPASEEDDIDNRYDEAALNEDDNDNDDDYEEEYGIATTTTTTSSSAAAYTASTRSLRHEPGQQQLSKEMATAKRAPPNGHLQSPATTKTTTAQAFTIGGRGGGGGGPGIGVRGFGVAATAGAVAANFHTKWQQRQPLHDQTTPLPPTHSMKDNVGQSHRGDGIAVGIRRIRRPRQWLTQQQQHNVDNDVDAGAGAPMQQQQRQRQQKQQPNAATANSGEDNESHIDGSGKRNYVEKGKAFIIEFLQGSSIHGFIYLAKMGLNFVERILWFAFICVALFSIISLSKRTWERFQTSPTVISMDRNKLVWNTSFPSLTVCPHKRIDELKVDDYIATHTELFENEDDEDLFRDFIVKLASLTYENIETLPINKSFGIPGEQYLDLIYELKWNFEPEISSGAAVQMFIYETLTEFGICHSVNSLVARYNSISYWKNNDWNLLDHGDRVTVHPLDGEIYAQIINLSTAYDVYFHGAGDVPNISKQRYTFPESDYTTVELIALEIYTNDAARAFTTKQRKCRFQHEADDMQTVPIYSFGLCLAECRMFFTLKICGCVPHFYRNRLKSGRVLPICGFQGLRCIADIKREVITLKSNRYKIDCNCLSNCDDSNFFVQSYRSRVWFLGANLQWGIIDYPKMQLRRDVLFSFADVLVYIGGLVGFFLGCSALSFTEIIYYFTARLVRRMFFS